MIAFTLLTCFIFTYFIGTISEFLATMIQIVRILIQSIMSKNIEKFQNFDEKQLKYTKMGILLKYIVSIFLGIIILGILLESINQPLWIEMITQVQVETSIWYELLVLRAFNMLLIVGLTGKILLMLFVVILYQVKKEWIWDKHKVFIKLGATILMVITFFSWQQQFLGAFLK